MKVIQNAVVSFGMVVIPVGIASAKTDKNEPTFRTLHMCGTPVEVRTAKNEASLKGDNSLVWCPACEVQAEVTVKGYEYAKDQFAQFTEEELEGVASPRQKSIAITKFVKANEIKPLMVEKSYWLEPSKIERLAEPYGLLYQSLAEMKRVGLGSQSIWGKEHPCVIAPNQDYAAGGVLQMLVLSVNEDIVHPDFAAPIPGRDQKKMAKQIIESMAGDLDPEKDLISNSRINLNKLIAARIEGKELEIADSSAPLEPDKDLMEALQATYDQVRGEKEKAKK